MLLTNLRVQALLRQHHEAEDGTSPNDSDDANKHVPSADPSTQASVARAATNDYIKNLLVGLVFF